MLLTAQIASPIEGIIMKTKRCPWILPALIILMLATLLVGPSPAFADEGSIPPDEIAQAEAQVPEADIVPEAVVASPQPDGNDDPAPIDSSPDGQADTPAESPEAAPSQDDTLLANEGADGSQLNAGEDETAMPAEEEQADSPAEIPADTITDDSQVVEQPDPIAAEGANEALSEVEPEAEAEAEAAPLQMTAKAAYKAEHAGWNLVSGNYYWYNKAGDTTPAKGWLVTRQLPSGVTGGLQRYWLNAKTGVLAYDTLVNTGSGVWTYARPEGYVVRGKYIHAENGYVYLADNDGKLENVGWLVSKRYDGRNERYWIDSKAHAAIPGYSSAGWNHYTRPEGYVVRGKYVSPETDYVYLANNDGKLEMGGSGKGGWLVTKKYDGRNERYWIDAKAHAAIPGYSNAGWLHYTFPSKGYVARGSFTDTYGRTGKANNDGKLLTARPVWNGWIVTSAFGQGLQRYWFENDNMVKDTLLSAKKAGWWAFARPEGYVVRGKYVHPETGRVYLANNDGKLADPGWIVTNAYDGGYQRYWIDSKAHAAVPGYSKDGWAHYTLEDKGYVARNQHQYIGDGWYYANNDGKLERKSPTVAQVIEQYVKWAVDIANDDSHGYTQELGKRWGPDYDCSSLVISALKAVGLKVGDAVYTGNMKSELTKYGWIWIEDVSQRRRGDILLNIREHTELYLGNGQNVGAHIAEDGTAIGKKPGDQTGHEIDVGPYWSKNWDGILRLQRIV